MPTPAIRNARKSLRQASSYAQWREAAQTYDELAGHQRWKAMDQSTQYDYRAIRTRVERLRELMASGDHHALLFDLNEGIHGNMGGMGHQELYHRARFGTKQLIVEYVDAIVDALDVIADPDLDDISHVEKLDFFRRAHHCFGQSALMMSGSGMLLYFHIGVVKALWEQRLLPAVLSGSSGGSLVGSIVATHTDVELARIFDPAYLVHKADPDQAPPSILQRLRKPMLEVREIKALIARLVPEMTFQEAYDKTGRHLNISISPAEAHQTSRLLNAVTSPNVLIREAILASCAVPGVYPPVTLAAKDKEGQRKPYLPGRRWVDGAVSDDLPAKRLARLYGVNHFIVSQTNPHVIPFISDTRRRNDIGHVVRVAAIRTAREWLNGGATLLRRPLARRPRLNRATNIVLSVLNQDYVGDINILPPYKFYNPVRLLTHLPETEIAGLMSMGERAAWPKLEMVRIQTRIGRHLDDVLRQYETLDLQRAAPRTNPTRRSRSMPA